jgi:hypothetical protein
MLHYAVASPLRVHGESSRDGSERLLDSPENNGALGFQPVFIRTIERRFPSFHRSSGMCAKIRAETLGRVLQAPLGINHPEVALRKMSKLQSPPGQLMG